MSEKKPVKRLNGSGKDILNADFTLQMNSSGYNDQYVDVTTDAVGNYTLLDKNNGRLITYNSDGQHLYTFGALGNRSVPSVRRRRSSRQRISCWYWTA